MAKYFLEKANFRYYKCISWTFFLSDVSQLYCGFNNLSAEKLDGSFLIAAIFSLHVDVKCYWLNVTTDYSYLEKKLQLSVKMCTKTWNSISCSDSSAIKDFVWCFMMEHSVWWIKNIKSSKNYIVSRQAYFVRQALSLSRQWFQCTVQGSIKESLLRETCVCGIGFKGQCH